MRSRRGPITALKGPLAVGAFLFPCGTCHRHYASSPFSASFPGTCRCLEDTCHRRSLGLLMGTHVWRVLPPSSLRGVSELSLHRICPALSRLAYCGVPSSPSTSCELCSAEQHLGNPVLEINTVGHPEMPLRSTLRGISCRSLKKARLPLTIAVIPGSPMVF